MVGSALNDPELDPYRTESQREWARWAAHGYRKQYQPRSIRRALAIVFTVLVVGIAVIFWLSATGRLPRFAGLAPGVA